ncbi:hypothetical protein C8J57DRAFT_1213184 [Mycena rebaudengoi]|nr:hypothetical protein C8J57DRAFT_1213184 [Mycena rebaudengoi]
MHGKGARRYPKLQPNKRKNDQNKSKEHTSMQRVARQRFDPRREACLRQRGGRRGGLPSTRINASSIQFVTLRACASLRPARQGSLDGGGGGGRGNGGGECRVVRERAVASAAVEEVDTPEANSRRVLSHVASCARTLVGYVSGAANDEDPDRMPLVHWMTGVAGSHLYLQPLKVSIDVEWFARDEFVRVLGLFGVCGVFLSGELEAQERFGFG